eukprot:NODE_4508_length_1054_cov_98.510204_g4306_i0.p1 GENE.NODE_4508_length_1054_cov_98.510204_g4306_i0~~NODE_4508_length_1054_cov_98.510204_g4306_i0.p1  ORF type:complete len:267 (+),score=44.91 NODE_4508_length_1054_cov_98.510204_g4306_i0:92-892(+)
MPSYPVALHEQARIPQYLRTTDNQYVLADPPYIYTDVATASRRRSPPPKANYYLKGEATSRRTASRTKRRLQQTLAHASKSKYLANHLSDIDIDQSIDDLPVDASPAKRTSQSKKTEQLPQAQPQAKVEPKASSTTRKTVTNQTIQEFMYNPRRYNALTLIDDQSCRTPSHFDKFRKDQPTKASRKIQSNVDNIDYFTGTLANDIAMGGTFAKIRLFQRHKNRTSDSNPVVHGEDDAEFWGNVKPKRDIRLANDVLSLITTIGCRK